MDYGARKLNPKEITKTNGGQETYLGGCNYSGGGSQCDDPNQDSDNQGDSWNWVDFAWWYINN